MQMSPVLRRVKINRIAISLLLFLVLLIGGGNLWATFNEVNNFRAQYNQQAKLQADQGKIIGNKICSTFGGLASLQPPPISILNPVNVNGQDLKRILVGLGVYEVRLHNALSKLGQDISCPHK